MWLFTKHGFFSVTQNLQRQDLIQIRARAEKDLLALKAAFPALDRCPVIETPDADYRWRLVIARWKWDLVGAALMADIDYCNFKGKIATIPGQRDKSNMLHDIWTLHHRYQESRHRPDPHAGHPELFRPHGDALMDLSSLEEGGMDDDHPEDLPEFLQRPATSGRRKASKGKNTPECLCGPAPEQHEDCPMHGGILKRKDSKGKGGRK
jgi:hypothetical protein